MKPSRKSAARLAHAAFYFRDDREVDDEPIFMLRTIGVNDFIPPPNKIEDCSLADFQYRAHTGKDVEMNSQSERLQANISYLVAKVMEMNRIFKLVCGNVGVLDGWLRADSCVVVANICSLDL